MNILIADDHQLFRNGLVSVLKKIDFVSTIHEAVNGKEVIDELNRQNNYDVIFMDINMPVMNGVDATRIAKHLFPAVKIIALTMYEDQKHVLEMMELGASGYMVKNTDSQEIKNALLKVMNNELFFSKQIAESLVMSTLYKNRLLKSQLTDVISSREKEILYLICHEYTSRQIASSLFISEKTVDWHRLHLLQKTNSKNIAGLVIFALKHGIIEDLVHN
jgi:DNA-binding NarL/FixJ family response regulator